MLFTTLTFSQMGHVMAIRSERDSLFRLGLFSNTWLLAAVIATIFAQLAVVYIPFLQRIFKTMPLSFSDVLIALGASMVLWGSVEVEKWFSRRREL
jgi:P-type Ca2+ transporter type 2C